MPRDIAKGALPAYTNRRECWQACTIQELFVFTFLQKPMHNVQVHPETTRHVVESAAKPPQVSRLTLGGSLVILMPFWSTATGKWGEG